MHYKIKLFPKKVTNCFT